MSNGSTNKLRYFQEEVLYAKDLFLKINREIVHSLICSIHCYLLNKIKIFKTLFWEFPSWLSG